MQSSTYMKFFPLQGYSSKIDIIRAIAQKIVVKASIKNMNSKDTIDKKHNPINSPKFFSNTFLFINKVTIGA